MRGLGSCKSPSRVHGDNCLGFRVEDASLWDPGITNELGNLLIKRA